MRSTFAFQLLHHPWIECIMRMFLHVWITSPSMVSLSLIGNVCSKCVGCLHSNPSMDEEAPSHHEQLQAWYLRAACKYLFLMCPSSILRPDIAMATYKKFSCDVRLKAWNLWALNRIVPRTFIICTPTSIMWRPHVCMMMASAYRTKICLKCARR